MKNLKIKLSALAVLAMVAIGVTFTSCQKDHEITNKSSSINNNNFYQTMSPNQSDFEFSQSEIEFIGSEHNRLCIEVYNLGLTNNYSTLFETLNTVLDNNDYENLIIDDYNFINSANNSTTFISDMITGIENDNEKQIIQDLVDALDNYQNVSTFTNVVEHLKSTANNQLGGLNKTAVLIALEVASNSSKMWALTEMGGQNYADGHNGITDTTPLAVSGKKVGHIVIADALGAYTGFLSGAAGYLFSGGPFNPISNAYLAGHTIIGAASFSISKALP